MTTKTINAIVAFRNVERQILTHKSIHALRDEVAKVFPCTEPYKQELEFSYFDDEGDKIILERDDEFEEAQRCSVESGAGVLHVQMELPSELDAVVPAPTLPSPKTNRQTKAVAQIARVWRAAAAKAKQKAKRNVKVKKAKEKAKQRQQKAIARRQKKALRLQKRNRLAAHRKSQTTEASSTLSSLSAAATASIAELVAGATKEVSDLKEQLSLTADQRDTAQKTVAVLEAEAAASAVKQCEMAAELQKEASNNKSLREQLLAANAEICQLRVQAEEAAKQLEGAIEWKARALSAELERTKLQSQFDTLRSGLLQLTKQKN